MRTTVNLDLDVYRFTSAFAGAHGLSLSAAVSELLRRAERNPQVLDHSCTLKLSPHGYFVIAGESGTLSLEQVRTSSEDELV